MPAIRYVLALPLLALPPATALTATFCAGSVAQLQDALTTASTNGAGDIIQIRAGHYLLTQRLEGLGGDGKNLFLIGGYNAGCATLDAAAATVMDGQGTTALLNLNWQGPVDAGIVVALIGLTWENGIDDTFFTAHLPPVGVEVFDGDLLVQRNVFRGNDSTDAICAVYMSSDHSVTVTNSLLVGNSADAGGGSPACLNADDPDATYAGTFHSNTVSGNIGPAGLVSLSGVKLGGTHAWSVANNILFGNSSVDIGIDAPADLLNNDIGFSYTFDGNSVSNSGALEVDPRFVSAADFRLRDDSPLHNAGLNAVPGGAGSDDLVGNPRIDSGTIDIGAYELQGVIFANGFE